MSTFVLVIPRSLRKLWGDSLNVKKMPSHFMFFTLVQECIAISYHL